MDGGSRLRGRRVAVTRPDAGPLVAELVGAGAEVVHVPLIEIGPPPDGGRGLRSALARLAEFDWLVVTSVSGVRAVAGALGAGGVRLAAVGPATAAALAAAAGRAVDLVPVIPRAEGLVAEFPTTPAVRVLVAQADRAAATVVDGLRAAGHDVEAVTAYATVSRRPDGSERAALRTADAVVFASGSAAQGWRDAGLGPGPAVVAIGPTTAAAAEAAGLRPDEVATAPDAGAVVAAVARALRARSGPAAASP